MSVTRCGRRSGHAGALIDEPWPDGGCGGLVQDEIEISVQVNGKLRARVSVAAPCRRGGRAEAALADERVQRFVGGKPPRKVIYVPGKLVNIVV